MKSLVRLTFLFLSAVIFSTVCAAQDVKYSWANGTDFSKFKTYKWQRAQKANYDDPVVDRILKTTIGEQLAAKGLTPTDDDTADVYVVYQMAVANDVEWSTFNSAVSWQTGDGFAGATTNATSVIRKGWLMIDIYNTAEKKLVWQANAVKTLGKGIDPKKMENNARKAMGKVFKNYPPRAK
ncbi:MAG TPA: DUF4136 domain-containing protein [Pyrinomonadaceae bacterium]|nr:DUF4136 domain-containing protein [Pyrinomonadaceae bacterium]